MHKSKKLCSFSLFLKIINFSNGARNKAWRPSKKRWWSCKPLVHLDEWNPHKTWKNVNTSSLKHHEEEVRARSNVWLGLGEKEGALIYSRYISTGWWLQSLRRRLAFIRVQLNLDHNSMLLGETENDGGFVCIWRWIITCPNLLLLKRICFQL